MLMAGRQLIISINNIPEEELIVLFGFKFQCVYVLNVLIVDNK